MAARLREHLERYPPAEVTLPWLNLGAPEVTHRLLFVGPDSHALRRSHLDTYYWKPALVSAGVLPPPEPGERHLVAREHGMHALRHFYASVLLDAGENIRALSDYLGHADPGFTLRTYTHLMPTSRSRTRRAVDSAFGWTDRPDGPETAPE